MSQTVENTESTQTEEERLLVDLCMRLGQASSFPSSGRVRIAVFRDMDHLLTCARIPEPTTPQEEQALIEIARQKPIRFIEARNPPSFIDVTNPASAVFALATKNDKNPSRIVIHAELPPESDTAFVVLAKKPASDADADADNVKQ